MGPRLHDDDRMDLNVHGVDRSLIRRARAHAMSLGLTLKAWLLGLIEFNLDASDKLSAKGAESEPPAAVPAPGEAPIASAPRTNIPPEGRHER